MLKRLTTVSNVFLVVTVVDFQYAHTSNGTEASLKIVESGVRYRAQKRGQSNTLCSRVALRLNKHVTALIKWVPYDHIDLTKLKERT